MDYHLRLLLPLFLVLCISYSSNLGVGALDQSPIVKGSLTVQDNSLVAISASCNRNLQTLFSLAKVNKPGLQKEIIRRESSGDPKICNKEFGCYSGMGLCGFIPNTWNSSLDRMTCSGKYNTKYCVPSFLPERCNEKICLPASKERTEMIFDTECHIIVCDWLLTTDGIKHWDPYSGPYDLSKYK